MRLLPKMCSSFNIPTQRVWASCIMGLAYAPLTVVMFQPLFLNQRLAANEIPGASISAYTPPPPDGNPPPSTVPTGSRGSCPGDSPLPLELTALAPYQHVGWVADASPEFIWYVPVSETYPTQFWLYEIEPNGQRKTLKGVEFDSVPGQMQYSPDVTLTVGKRYQWEVVVICDPDRPDKNLVVEAELQVASLPESVKDQLEGITDPAARASLYAEAGFWYDALAEAVASPSTRLELLQGLTQLESQGDTISSQVQTFRLQQILEFEQEQPAE